MDEEKIVEKDDFGDFEELKEEKEDKQPEQGGEPEQFVRARMPRGRELIGKITQRLGGNRMTVLSTDGKSRNCRVPGRYKRRLWLRPGDIVLIEPWADDDSKGDVIFKYMPNGINQLKKKGLLDSLKEEF